MLPTLVGSSSAGNRHRPSRGAYRLGVARSTALLAGSLVALLLVATGGSQTTASALRLDGKTFRPELALTPDERGTGLMNRRRAPADGMLFVFPERTDGGFWMKNTLVPLTIVFFDADGDRARRMSMLPCREDPCRIYNPGRSYRFALELRASDTRKAAKLGPLSELRRLVRRAR
jgi:uncharacterized membrane protein (UPF0127 family)